MQDSGAESPKPKPESPGPKEEGPSTAWEPGLFVDPEFPGSGWMFTTEWVGVTDAVNERSTLVHLLTIHQVEC